MATSRYSTAITALSIVVLTICLLTTQASVAGAAVGASPAPTDQPAAASPGGSGALSASAATAATTNVTLVPATTDLTAGNSTTVDIVVDPAADGVGAYDLQVNSTDSSVVSIDTATDATGGISEVTVADDGSGVQIAAFNGDTQQTGAVVIASVTVTGLTNGSAGLSVAVETLADEADNAYTIQSEQGTALSVSGDSVGLSLTANQTSIDTGETVAFSVTRADTNDPVNATVAVDGRSVQTGPDGNVDITFPDAGEFTATAFNQSVRDPAFRNDSVDIAVRSPDAPTGPTVELSPAQTALNSSDTRTFEIVADGIDNGVGAYDLQVASANTSRATITDARDLANGNFVNVGIAPDGQVVNLTVASSDTAQVGPVVLATVTIEGGAPGDVQLTPTVRTLGDEDNNEYPVAQVRGAQATITAATVPLALAANTTQPVVDEPVALTLTRTDTGAGIAGELTVGDRAVSTDANGTAVLRPATAGELSVRGTAPNTTTTRYAPATLVLTVQNDSAPPVVGNSDNPPRDPDGDGRYEDINGNGEFNVIDVSVLLDNFRSDAVSANSDLYDFNGDGEVNIIDVNALLQQLP